MIPLTCFKGFKVAVFGLGRSGLAAVRALEAGGAEVHAWDDSEAAREGARKAGVGLDDLSARGFGGLDGLVLAPGVPLTHPEPHWSAARAQAAGIEVIGDMELLLREIRARGSRARIVGVTGTNGKSTTVALIAHLLSSAGIETALGGNIGRPLLDLDLPGDDGVLVLELSSYQIDLTPGLHVQVAVLLNITSDHLDRHGDMARYAAIKARIFDNQDETDTAVVGTDDEPCRAIAARLARRRTPLVRVSAGRTLDEGVYVRAGVIHEAGGGAKEAGVDISGVETLRGVHNWQNAAAAYAAARALGLARGTIATGLASFAGLAHRMEPVGRLGGVLFVNDSKATNAEAAARALACYDRIFWIAGGRPKAGGIDSLNSFFPKIEKAYLIGEAAPAFAATLEPHTAVEIAGTLDEAVAQAAADVAGSDTAGTAVLLSPACASFDQFADFEARGEAFRAAVSRIDGVEMIERPVS